MSMASRYKLMILVNLMNRDEEIQLLFKSLFS